MNQRSIIGDIKQGRILRFAEGLGDFLKPGEAGQIKSVGGKSVEVANENGETRFVSMDRLSKTAGQWQVEDRPEAVQPKQPTTKAELKQALEAMGIDTRRQPTSELRKLWEEAQGAERQQAQAEVEPFDDSTEIELQAAPVQKEGQPEATAGPEDLVKVSTLGYGNVWVRQSDLDNPAKTRLRTYTSNGKPKTDQAIHRENIDLDGSKLKERAKEEAENPLFDVITSKDGRSFGSRGPATYELRKRGLQESHEVVEASKVQDGLKGWLIRRKAAQTETRTEATGPVFTEYRHDAQGAIARLMQEKGGEAVAALHHPEVGDIDLIWGSEGTSRSDGSGLAKLIKYHPEVLDDLQGILSSLSVVQKTENRIQLESPDHKATVRLDWNGDAKTWLLTAFEKGEKSRTGTRADTAGISVEDDTARLNSALDSSITEAQTGQAPKPRTEKEAKEQRAKQSQSQKPETATPTTKIENVGEHLEGSRKDKAAALREAVTRELSDAEITSQPLSKIWPKESVDQIEDAGTAAIAQAARDAIPTKPRKAYALKAWVDKVKALRETVGSILNGEISKAELMEKMRGLRSLEHLAAKIDLLEHIDRKHWRRIGSVEAYPNSYRYNANGDKVPSPHIDVEIDGKRMTVRVGTLAEAMAAIHAKLGDDTVTAKAMQFEVRERRSDKRAFINKKGDPLYRELKEFKTTKEAFDFIKNNHSDLVAAWEKVKERDNVTRKDVRNKENRQRSAKDWRKGKDVGADDFKEAFGFRGVEFGEWVSQGKGAKERQGMINQAYDAFMDLAQIVGIPPKAISLNGSLGIGFGSRGSGWASAHFEPGNIVINLTKTRGAGSLAHEWFHALDNYFSRERQGEVPIQHGINAQEAYRRKNYITYAPEPMLVYKKKNYGSYKLTKAEVERRRKRNPQDEMYAPENWEADKAHPQGVRQEVEAALAELVRVLNESPMKARADSLDKGKTEGYWSRIIERGARSFENYVIHKMMLNGYHNDYLANVTQAKDFVRNLGRYPYLLEEEVGPVAEAFDDLFATIQTRETDKGVALFSRSASPAPLVHLSGTEVANNITSANVVEMARNWYRKHLQNQKPARRQGLGDVHFTGRGWKELRFGLKNDVLKARLLPAVRTLIEQGQYHGREPLHKERKDDVVAFHFFSGAVVVDGAEVTAGVTVSEDASGNLFYNVSHEASSRWQKRSPQADPWAKATGLEGVPADGKPSTRLSVVEGDGNVNLTILNIGTSPTVDRRKTPVATIRQALKKAYSGLLDVLETKGLVTLTQTQEQVLEAAAKARARVTGERVEDVRKSLMQSVINSKTVPEAQDFKTAIEALSPAYEVRLERAGGGSVYASVFFHTLKKDGLRHAGRTPTSSGFKVRFAGHGAYWGATISIDPVSGNSLDDAVKLFKYLNHLSDEPVDFYTSRIIPESGEMFRQKREFNPRAPDKQRRITDQWKVGKEERVANVSDSDLYFQRAWHGTPHRGIEKTGFKLNKIGTGEGAQAYGWGMYFAGNRDVAEGYRASTTKPEVEIAGKRFRADNSGIFRDESGLPLAATQKQVFEHASRGLWGSKADKPVEVLAEEAESYLQTRYGVTQKQIQAAKQAILNGDIKLIHEGQLYSANIPEDSDLLDWDKPLSEQPEKVRAALNRGDLMARLVTIVERPLRNDAGKQFASEYGVSQGGARPEIWFPSREVAERERTRISGSNPTGQEIYAALGSAQAASEYLQSIGIPGLRYLDGSSRRDGEGSHNYVIWDEALLTPEAAQIEPRYSANGNIEGFFDPVSGQSFLIADALTAESAPGTLMHEVGIHMAADGTMQPLFDRAQALVNEGNGQHEARAKARMAQAGETSAEEAAAYLVTEYENDRTNASTGLKQFIKDLYAAVRAWLHGKGFLKADSLSVADIAAIARANARSLADMPLKRPKTEAEVRRSRTEAETQRQFRETERAYGGREAYDKAKAAGKTKLNYNQWVQVRTPNFKEWFGDWEIASAKPERKATSFAEAREAAKAFQGKPLINHGAGITATVSRNNLDKMLSQKAVGKSTNPATHSAVVANLDGMFERAILGWSKPDSEGDPNIKAIHRFFTPVVIDGKAMMAKITVKETVQDARTNPLYTVEAVSFDAIKNPAAQWVGEIAEADGFDPRTTRSAGSVLSMAERVQRFNTESVSKVIDPQTGEPRVVYHGASKSFTEFKAKGALQAAFFTDSKELADSYAQERSTKNSGAENTYAVFLHMPAPMTVDAKGAMWDDIPTHGIENNGKAVISLLTRGVDAITTERAARIAAESGFDGAVINNVRDGFGYSREAQPGTVYAATRPNQIKSATGNDGTFGKDNNDIRFSRAGTGQQQQQQQTQAATPPKPPRESFLRKQQRLWQDKLNRFSVIKDWLKEQGVTLSERADVYKAEERMHSRYANKAEDFREKRVKPLIERIQKAGFTLDEVAQFLHAQHAKERNDHVAKVNQRMPDGGSGMTTKEAAAILAQASPELAKLANELRAITEDTLNIRVRAGIISQEQADAYGRTFQHYVPLRGGPEDGNQHGSGSGLAVRHKEKRALGHQMREGGEWIIENILADHQRAIMQAEKNLATAHLVNMAIEIGNDELITINKPKMRQFLKKHAFELLHKGQVVGTYETREEAQSALRRATSLTGESVYNFGIQKTTDPRVFLHVEPMLAENEVLYYVNGHEMRVQINDELLARAYKNMGADTLNTVVKAGAALNAYFSRIYTGYNPEFIVTNIVRDFTTGLANIIGEEGLGMAAKSVANYADRFMDLLKYAHNGTESKWIKEYRQDGGNTGAAYLSDLERLGEDIKTDFAAYLGVMANLKAGDFKNAARAAGRKVFDKTLRYIEVVNQAGENAMRLAVYQAMVESGKSREAAASMAKNVTVNFNRKGELGQTANALWLFFNAGVQGSAAVANAHVKGKHRAQAWAFSSALAGLGYVLSLMAAGGDDEEYEKLSEYEKSRNLLIKAGDGFVKIPIPYGHGFFWNLGRGFADSQRTGELGGLPWHLASSFMEEFTPFGNMTAGEQPSAEQAFLYSLPTVAQIAGAPLMNRSAMGGTMMPDSAFDKHQHDRDKMWRATRGTLADDLAGALESVGLDVSPETLKHLNRTFTGGAGSFATSVFDLAKLTAEGAGDIEAKEIPFARRFYTVPDVRGARRRYYDAKEEADAALSELNRARKARDYDKVTELSTENAELIHMSKLAGKMSKRLKAARDKADAIRLEGGYTKAEERAAIREIEREEEKLYDNYMTYFKQAKANDRARVERGR